MKLQHYKIILICIGLVIVLAISSLTFIAIVPESQGEKYSELYLLGHQHMAKDYPKNIGPNQNYTIYYDVVNHVGAPTYYLLYIKFLNSSDNLPDTTLTKASSSKPVYEYRFVVLDNQTFENPLTFSISNTAVSNGQFFVGNLQLNGEDIKIDKTALWNSTKSEFQYKLLFELWLYNNISNMFEFNNRFVYLQLNCTNKT